ncbi:MAG: PAS domain-containing protein [Aurantimonas endophytica]
MTMSPLGLLAPIAALFSLVRGRAARLLFAILAAAVGCALLVALVDNDLRTQALSLTAFLAAAISIAAIVSASLPSPIPDALSPGTRDDAASRAASPLARVHPEDREAAEQAISRAFRSGIPQIITCRQRQTDGSYRNAEFRADAGYSVSVPVKPMVQTPDEPWTTAEELGETADAVRAAKVVEALHGAAFAFDPSGTFTYASPVAQTSIAMTLETLNRRLGEKSFMDGGDLGWKLGVHPDDYEAAAARLRTCLRTGEHFNFEYRVLRATGDYVWHQFAIRPTRTQDGRITGWYGLGFDIDVYKKTEAALREREKRLQQIIDTVPALIWCINPAGIPSYLNRRVTEVTGITLQDMIGPDGSRSLAVIHPDDREAMDAALTDSISTGKPLIARYRQRRADGQFRWVDSRAEPLRDETGAIVEWYGVSVDIEDLIATQEALRERERFLWQLVETLPAMIDCAAPDGEPVYRSQQLREFLGFGLDELDEAGKPRLAGTLDAGVHPDDVTSVREIYAHSLATGEPYARRHRLRRFDGAYRWVETRAAPMRNGDGDIVQWNVICLDIDGEVRAQDELRLARDRLARASQAASLAELSASIAHEVNQPLMAVVAYANACQRWLTVDPPNLERARGTVERAIDSATTAADVVSRIRSLFKHATDTRTATSLETVIMAARDLMAEEAARLSVRVDLRIEADLPIVTADRIQIQQVLINLMRNGMEAMEAMPRGRAMDMRALRQGVAIRVEIGDRGPGIENPEKLFEPFFTTKQAGMGMGLAICRSIVESHGGRLWVEQNEPCGARFVFTLPAAPLVAP